MTLSVWFYNNECRILFYGGLLKHFMSLGARNPSLQHLPTVNVSPTDVTGKHKINYLTSHVSDFGPSWRRKKIHLYFWVLAI